MTAYIDTPQTMIVNHIDNSNTAKPSQTSTASTSVPSAMSSDIPTKADISQMHQAQKSVQQPVSPNNPCPFLRGLVAQGLLADDQASLQAVVDAIHQIQTGQDPDAQGKSPLLPSPPLKVIAATANGFAPNKVAHNMRHGVQLNQLRHGPFDKEGAGSRILDTHGEYVQAELERLASFATNKTDASGQLEKGLNKQEIQEMLDANFERAKGHRRAVDRTLMNGEFPILLKILGKQGTNQQGKSERYLAVTDVGRLFKERQFPERMASRIGLVQK